MAQIYVIGRITSDIEVKSSQKGNDYVRFDIAENIGSKDRSRTQYFQVWAFNENARKLIASKAKKGSLVAVSGSVGRIKHIKIARNRCANSNII